MRRYSLLPAFALIAASACQAQPADPPAANVVEAPAVPAAGETVVLRAVDGVAVHGRFYGAAKPKAMILLFHQAGSSKDEYASIAPRLVEAGYSALAIDQRSGDRMFGPNLTVDALGGSRDYAEAAPDLDAAIDWAKAKGAPIILWGSSYSAALVFPVAAKRPDDIVAILAFSPDEYLDGIAVGGAAAKLSMPLFVTSASDPKEIAAARKIVAASPAIVKQQFVPTLGGVHGSSTLIAKRNAKGAEENMTAVLAFLGRVTS